MGYTYHSEVTSGADMLSEADLALRQAKLQGTNRWAKLSDVRDGEAPVLGRTLQEWQAFLEQTISDHSIVLYFQPVLSLPDKTVVAHEVFVRFINGDDLLTAGIVIPIAERLGPNASARSIDS